MNTDNSVGSMISPVQTAEYVADMSSQLSALASKSGMDVVAYLLELARLEAEENAKAIR